jgi:hypothetical protein
MHIRTHAGIIALSGERRCHLRWGTPLVPGGELPAGLIRSAAGRPIVARPGQAQSSNAAHVRVDRREARSERLGRSVTHRRAGHDRLAHAGARVGREWRGNGNRWSSWSGQRGSVSVSVIDRRRGRDEQVTYRWLARHRRRGQCNHAAALSQRLLCYALRAPGHEYVRP